MAKGYRTFITTGDFDAEKFPIPPKRIVASAAECVHTPVPSTYHAWYEWCEQAGKTHSQIRCPRCGNWAIWLPKKEAAAINRKDEAEARKFVRQMEVAMALEAKEKASKILRKRKKEPT